MKRNYFLIKTLATLVVALFVSTALFAQEEASTKSTYNWQDHRHSLSVSAGSPSLFSGTVGILTALFDAFEHTGNPHVKIFGSYGIHYGYNALSWLRVGGSFVYSGWNELATDAPANYYHKESYHEFSFIGKVDFTYLNREHVRLYSGVGIGGILNMTDTYGYVSNFAPDSERTYFPNLAWTVTPIGIEAGGKYVYGLAEINIGTADLLRAGIGVRF